MTPSFIGRYAMMSSGVRPSISLASFPTASILLSREMATTDGSLRTMPFPGTKTSTVVVPRSMPSLGEKKKDIMGRNCTPSHQLSESWCEGTPVLQTSREIVDQRLTVMYSGVCLCFEHLLPPAGGRSLQVSGIPPPPPE